MPNKRVRLYIDSDTKGVESGIKKTQGQLRGFENSAKKTQGTMRGLSTTASTLGLAFGAAGLAVGIKSSIDAFKEQEKSSARVIATLKTLGVNTDAMRKKIADVTTAQSKLSGFQDEELQSSFATILRVTKDVNESFKLNALAMDISRGSGKNLNAVAIAIAKVADGNAGALGRYGIKAQKGATSTDVLAEAQRRYAGQAKEFGDTTAGAAEKANAQINELQESVGAKLAPAMNSAAGATIKLADATGNFVDHAGGIGPLFAGAAGFGAFNLLAPRIGAAGTGIKNLGAEAKLAGGGIKGLGTAVAGTINPMTVAGIGVGLLAGGIYELWHNGENADQAIQGLNSTIKGLNSALDQKTAAKDAVKSAQDYVKATKDAETAARSRASALHADIVQLKEHKGTEAQVEAATKKWRKALDDVVPTVHAHQRATHDLVSAQRNLKTATDGVNVASDTQSRKADDVRGKIDKQAERAQRLAGNWREVGKNATTAGSKASNAAEIASRKTAIWASSFDRAADATRRTNKLLSTTDSNLANVARSLGRIPTNKEIRITGNLTAAGKSVDFIVRRLEAIHDKKVNVQFNQTFGARVNPLTGLPVHKADGGMIPGRYSDGDTVPAMLSGGEAVLNPRQIAMVDSGMSVLSALDATGAPTKGAGFAGGKKPNPFHYPRSNLTGVKRTTLTPSQQALKAIDKRKEFFNLALAKSDQALVNAQGTGTIDDDLLAYSGDTRQRNSYQRWLGRVLANPGKTLGFPGAKLTAQQRTDLINEQTAQTRAINDNARAVYELMHPDVDTAAAGDSGEAGSIDAGGGGDAGISADAQAQLDQKQTIINQLTRSGGLSEAALRGFGSSGDIGVGGFANAFEAARGGPSIAILGDPRSLMGLAAGFTQGVGLQPSVSATSGSVRV